MSATEPSLEIVDAGTRPALSLQRAEVWRDWMTPEQFATRNERLWAHDFGRERCKTYGWRVAGELVCAMDTLDVTLGLTTGDDDWSEEPAILIASVLTPEANRGKGYAGAMIGEYFRQNPERNAVLYSDIGPPFYERFGFRAFPRFAVERPVGPLADSDARPIKLASFARKLGDLRYNTLLDLEKPGATLLPDAALLDWHLERFRYFAEVAETPFFDRLFWTLDHGEEHLLAFVPHFPQRKLDGLWVEQDCEECLEFASGLAGEWGMTGFRYWTANRLGPNDEEECPMVRVPRLGTEAIYHDVQLCDWW